MFYEYKSFDRAIAYTRSVFLSLYSVKLPFTILHNLDAPHSKMSKLNLIVLNIAAASTHIGDPTLEMIYS